MNQKEYSQAIKDGLVELEVFIFRRPNMRDESLEYELHMGRRMLDNIFDGPFKVDETVTEAFFSFPENWTNIIEQRALIPRMFHYYPNLKKLTIKTQSVYIIQCTPGQCCRIVQCPGEENGLPGDDGPIDSCLASPMVMNVINAKGLNVFGATANHVISVLEKS